MSGFSDRSIKVVRETEELRLRSMHFYSSNLRTEVILTEMGKRIRKAHLEKDLELALEMLKFPGPIRHPRGDAHQVTKVLNQGRHPDWRY